MKTKILKLLKEHEGYLSGQDLCESMQVSRTAVWKVIKQLQEEGYRIEAVRNRGYRLLEVADVMTEAELKSRMDDGLFGRFLEYRDIVDSTNNTAKKLAEEGAQEGTLVVSESQSAGKGRRGRMWVSPKGTGIWMSLVLRPGIAPSCASMLTLVAALAVADGIEKVSGLDSRIKWPNDIVINGKKVCGILTEMSAELEGIHYVVIGIGINANMEELPEDIRDTATSVFLESGAAVNRGEVIAAVMKAMETYYDKFLETVDLSLLMEDYERKLANKDREVEISGSADSYRGVCLGIDKTGELLVQLDDKTVKRVVSGEVSVRGIYGYV